MGVVAIVTGLAGLQVYTNIKTTQLEEKIAVEVVLAGGQLQKNLRSQDGLTASEVRKALSFLSVFSYIKCAEYSENGIKKGAWPIPVCAPILKENATRPITSSLSSTASVVFHIDSNHINTIVSTERSVFVAIILTMMVALGFGMVVFMVNQVTHPFEHVAQHLEADAQGMVQPVPPKGGREFRQFISAYNKLVSDIAVKTAEVVTWRTRIKAELAQASSVQNLLVPEKITTPMIDARAVSLRELSGDFHEVFHHQDGRQTFILGDVAGKGIYAAMMLAQTLTAFRAAVEEASLPEVLVKLNTLIEDRFPDGLFVALTLLRISADGRSAELFVTGNPDAVFITTEGELELFASTGPAIGVLPPVVYGLHEAVQLDLTRGRLYLFSDGVSDLIIGENNEGFANDEALHNYLNHIDHEYGDAALDAMMDVFQRFEQLDDVTIARITTSAIEAKL